MLYLFVALKIPLIALFWLIWWAVRQEPELEEPGEGGQRVRARRIRRRSSRAPRGAGRTAATPSRSRRRGCGRSMRGRGSTSARSLTPAGGVAPPDVNCAGWGGW